MSGSGTAINQKALSTSIRFRRFVSQRLRHPISLFRGGKKACASVKGNVSEMGPVQKLTWTCTSR